MATTYDIGDVVRVTCTFTNGAGANTDPTTVTLKVKTPAQVTTPYTWALGTVTRSAVGIFYKDISLTMSGEWFYRFEGTGAVESAEEANILVEASEFY
jgi:hypothetical protein